MVKKTVAIIGSSERFCPSLLKSAIQQEMRLLFISPDEEKAADLGRRLAPQMSTCEAEFLSCEKEGCWEADVVVFTSPTEVDNDLLERIKEVSVQKLVLVIFQKSERADINRGLCFYKLLPHSKVVELEIESRKFRIFGRNKKANQLVQSFFEFADYNLIE